MNAKTLTLRDMTRGTGCTPRTVRYYERQGLLRAQRSAGGHRLFAASELERLRFIISLREAGWSLEEVTELLGLRDHAPDDAKATAELRALVSTQIDRLEQKIEVLQVLLSDFKKTAQLLPVCGECTKIAGNVRCEQCAQLPALGQLPRAFRLIWRAGELDRTPIYDEAAADGSADDEDDCPQS